MRLYTIHHKSYIPTTPSEWALNTASQMDGTDYHQFKIAYKWLYDKLGVERATWCYDWSTPRFEGEDLIIYHLEVPEDRILAAVNSDVWCYILNDWLFTDKDLEGSLRDFSREMKLESWNRSIFSASSRTEYLIPNPIDPSWILATEPYIWRNEEQS